MKTLNEVPSTDAFSERSQHCKCIHIVPYQRLKKPQKLRQFLVIIISCHLLFHKYFCKCICNWHKENLKEFICKFLGHNSLARQILVFCEFTFILLLHGKCSVAVKEIESLRILKHFCSQLSGAQQ